MVLQTMRRLVLLPLRYAFLGGLLLYHWAQGVLTPLLAPFQPLLAETRKLPDSDISLSGILRTLTRAYFLALLLGFHYVKMAADLVLVPVGNWLTSLRKTLGIPDPSPALEPRD